MSVITVAFMLIFREVYSIQGFHQNDKTTFIYTDMMQFHDTHYKSCSICSFAKANFPLPFALLCPLLWMPLVIMSCYSRKERIL